MENHKCTDCGFLAVLDGNKHLVEVPRDFRETGSLPKPFSWEPYCYKAAFFLDKEFHQTDQGRNERHRSFVEVINKDRPCQKFTDYRPEHSPREHEEMQASEIAERAAERRDEAQAKWQAEQRRLDLEWRAEESRRADERHAEQLKQQLKQGRGQIFVVGGLATLVMAATTIIGAMIQAGYIFPPPPK